MNRMNKRRKYCRFTALGVDEIDYKGESTCIIRVVGNHEAKEKKVRLGTNQQRVFDLLKERILPNISQDEDMETVVNDVANLWIEQPSNKRTNLIRSNITKLVEYGLVGTGLR